ncbi:Triacylglycerol esterase/lipase EstA, alpha/beta hydrolase fold [Blastococcus aurantiacus]|uniref:Triacylglycerol esterase/lipase EstA, alpha/beta hydrolase fold n=1 Tax=Blastococcus aurantiacus TaxID=1550231 RepID=A0A1G7LZV8_9ACTN|nr:alpha/beta fold hydrolase [Blastococcus aurantiacus]SDF54931.1 Triacylglycerol esterase/lipase EstA, alpha/beta hydrolase fold [Blastococcus aurantiacus]
MLAGLSPARRRVVLVVLALASIGAAVLAGVVHQRPSAADPQPADQDRLGPVLLVPGYGGATGALQLLADRLTAAGRDATVVGLPGDGTGDLTASADALDAAATAALERTGDPAVDVVGFSAGGIVARLWVADGNADVVRRVVTLGSPHHGTDLAGVAGALAPAQCPVACRQLAPGSELLAELNAGDETPEGPSWVSIWTTRDRVVPPESSRLGGALELPVQSVCAGAQVEHSDLPRDGLVQEMVLAELAAGEPVELGPADCARLS